MMSAGQHGKNADMIYELRVYATLPGRMPALQSRFANHTLRIWERFGIRQAGFWTTLIGDSNNELTYMIAWESLAEREQKWNMFQVDPEWVAARADSEKDGPILANIHSQFLVPTAFSSVK
jgi:NIPSNAP